MLNETKTAIETLRREAAEAGDTEQVARCERADSYQLYDYETNEPLTPAELGVDAVRYVDLILLSRGAGHTGAVAAPDGRTVYAD